MYAAYLYIQRALLSDRAAPPPPAPRTPAPDGPTGLEAEGPRTRRVREKRRSKIGIQQSQNPRAKGRFQSGADPSLTHHSSPMAQVPVTRAVAASGTATILAGNPASDP